MTPEMRRLRETASDMALARMRLLKTSVAPAPIFVGVVARGLSCEWEGTPM